MDGLAAVFALQRKLHERKEAKMTRGGRSRSESAVFPLSLYRYGFYFSCDLSSF